jgi:hypothetical protein
MRMKALDSFHASDVGMLHAGTEFEVSDARGAEMTKRGLAIEVADAPKVEETADETPRRVKQKG